MDVGTRKCIWMAKEGGSERPGELGLHAYRKQAIIKMKSS